MARQFLNVFAYLAALSSVHAYFLVGVNNILTIQRLDPIVDPGTPSGHVHTVFGGSNFGSVTNTSSLRDSECTSMPIQEDKSNYWFPHLYFQWANGSFTSLTGGVVVYYLFDDTPGSTKPFPDDFRMISGDPTLRTYNASSYAQQAITFLCLDFDGTTTHFNALPNQACPSGVRAQINFPMCWDGKNTDSADHKSHVAFPSGGPDSGTCSDPNFPVTLPRVFMEVYWDTTDMDPHRSEAMNTTQPYVYSYGDRTGYGYHADFINGWKSQDFLQKVLDGCTCDPYGSTDCCVAKGLFTIDTTSQCRITDSLDEQTTGTLDKLPGNNPVQEEGKTASMFPDPVIPAIISPVYVYTGTSPSATGMIVTPARTVDTGAVVAASATVSVSIPSSSSESTPAGQTLVAVPSASAVASAASAAAASPTPGSGTNSSDSDSDSSEPDDSDSSSNSCSSERKRKRTSELGMKRRRALHKARVNHDSHKRFTPNAY